MMTFLDGKGVWIHASMTFKILVGITGSVATIKIVSLIQELLEKSKAMNLHVDICLVATDSAIHFIPKDNILLRDNIDQIDMNNVKQTCILPINSNRIMVLNSDIKYHIPIYTEHDEWLSWNELGDPILHIELSKWANVFLIAPIDANTLAKLACGLCDNLLLCILRAVNINANPRIFICPAMNTAMWNHPLTAIHINTLTTPPLNTFGYVIVEPISKKLACQDIGIGAMADIPTIIDIVFKHITMEIQ